MNTATDSRTGTTGHRGRRLLPALVGVAALLSGCAAEEISMSESTWMVTNIYTAPEEIDVVSDLVRTQPTLDFGFSSLSGHTGCAPFRASVEFLLDGERSVIDEADQLRLSNLAFDTLPEDCQGQERIIHEALVELLPNSFGISRRSAGELLLRSELDSLDPPSIRLVSWVAPG